MFAVSRFFLVVTALSLPAVAFAQDAAVGSDAGVGDAAAPDAAAGPSEEASQPPRILRSTKPSFPPSERGKGLHPNVVLRVTIDTHGEVTEAEVATSAGKAFDEAALAAVRDWEFAPAIVAGEPVESRIRVAVHFEEPEPPAAAPLAPEEVTEF